VVAAAEAACGVRQDPIAATLDEYRAFDSLPPVLRELLRTSPYDISARKTLGRLIREGDDAEKVASALRAWIDSKRAKEGTGNAVE